MTELRINECAKGSSVASSAAPAALRRARALAVQTLTDAAAWWQQHDQRVYQCIKLWVEQWFPPVREALLDAVGQVFGEHRVAVGETLTNLKERVIRLETTSNFEERFTKLAHEVERGPELPQSELLARIEALQRQVDEVRSTAQPGPQGAPGKLPCVKDYKAGRVHYGADVVTHAGALWQARGDTVAPPHSD